MFLNRGNEADGDVYLGMPARFQGYGEGDAKQHVDLEAWRHAHGWDRQGHGTDTGSWSPRKSWRETGMEG